MIRKIVCFLGWLLRQDWHQYTGTAGCHGIATCEWCGRIVRYDWTNVNVIDYEVRKSK